MNYKIIHFSLLFLLTGCLGKNNLFIQSKYETVYSKTIDNEKFELIYQILKENVSDLPSLKSKKIKYKVETNKYFLSLYLNKNYFKLVYRSNLGYDDKIETIKSKIENVK
tara:strand:+ start:709 stop:1038 length:330 start_codon:yes stop_codon:yes gene_type:complete